MTNQYHSTLYIGVTNNLLRRVNEHKNGTGSHFTARYKVNKLVYYEMTNSIQSAILREKQIKSGSRQKKIDLVKSVNSEWQDLSDDF